MPLELLRYGLARRYPAQRFFPARAPLRPSYDVVIIGGGGHGLATAYYLAKDHGAKSVAVLERGWLAGGNTARNTAIIRSNYLTPEGVRFYDESVRLFQDLSADFDLNILYSTRGHLTLAHTDAAVRTARWRAEVNKHLGVNSSLVWPDDIRRLCPELNLSDEVRYPILAALYHPPGSIARHDAVAWGYARGAARRGGDRRRLPASLVDLAAQDDAERILAIDDAICRLEREEPDVAAVVRLRFYAGLTIDETAATLSLSPRQVDRLWSYARARLHRDLSPED